MHGVINSRIWYSKNKVLPGCLPVHSGGHIDAYYFFLLSTEKTPGNDLGVIVLDQVEPSYPQSKLSTEQGATALQDSAFPPS